MAAPLARVAGLLASDRVVGLTKQIVDTGIINISQPNEN